MDPASAFMNNPMVQIGTSYLSGLASQGGDRVSHERFMENETRADWSNQREVGRYNTFLSGVTGNQAKEYNNYQDATFGQDTQREIDRIKTQADQLGMSPWELKGQAGSAQPAPAFTGGGASPAGLGEKFMSNMIPLQIAKMNNRTALATTAMQTQASMRNTDQQQGKSPLAKAQIMAAQGQAAYQQAGTDKLNTDNVLAALQFVSDQLPETQLNTLVGNLKFKQGWDKMIGALTKSKIGKDWTGATPFSSANTAIDGAFQSFNKNEQAAFLADLDSMLQAAADQATDLGSDFMKGLGNLGGNIWSGITGQNKQ